MSEMVVISVEPWEKEKEEPNDTRSVHSSQTSQGMLFGFQDLASDYFQVRFCVESFFPYSDSKKYCACNLCASIAQYVQYSSGGVMVLSAFHFPFSFSFSSNIHSVISQRPGYLF